MRFCLPLLVFILLLSLIAVSCDDGFDLDDQAKKSMTPIHTYKSHFMDEHGRYLFIHGVNLSGSTKIPTTEDPVSYVGKPFKLDEADKYFSMLQRLGMNTVRLLVIWEAIEPYQSGVYDEEYLDYVEKVVAAAQRNNIYVFLDMHQDFFSRHLKKYFNDKSGAPAIVDSPMRPPMNNLVQGDGAPQWVVELCLPEKNVGGPEWGLPRWMVSDQRNTTDVTSAMWGLNMFISLDVSRCFATFFAGSSIYPNYGIGGKNIQDFLQDSFAQSWVQVVRRVKDYPNVIGYDIINEPVGIYVPFDLYALLYEQATKSTQGILTEEQVENVLDKTMNALALAGVPEETIELFRQALADGDFLPRTPEQFEQAGFSLSAEENDPYRPDLDAALALNLNFNRHYLQPFFERVGAAIQEEDPEAIIFIEHTLGLPESEGLGWFTTPMLAPEGIDQVAYAPHFYTDVYPFPGIPQIPRDFTVDEIQYRDLTEGVLGAIASAAFSLGKPPVVLGEFGTYFNLGGIEKAMAEDYIIPANILDNYYEVLDEQLVQRTVWCFSSENTARHGEGWNDEDFSILGPDQQPRAIDAYARIVPRATSGRLTSFKYNSPLAYYEPRPGVPTPIGEFTMEMEGLETSAPTEVAIPAVQYPDGFYVYVSSGRCTFDEERRILSWYPADDDPEAKHHLRIRPPWENYGDTDWDYLIKGDDVIEGRK
jgi:aryl-phospho-beta-D-glucosidase BglC (GH1 family)